ncbi:hypothetical protein Dimus_002466 [Dionaea muscipula]
MQQILFPLLYSGLCVCICVPGSLSPLSHAYFSLCIICNPLTLWFYAKDLPSNVNFKGGGTNLPPPPIMF